MSDNREMYQPPEPEPIVDLELREALSRRKGTSHNHKPDEVCPVPGCPSVVNAQAAHDSETF